MLSTTTTTTTRAVAHHHHGESDAALSHLLSRMSIHDPQPEPVVKVEPLASPTAVKASTTSLFTLPLELRRLIYAGLISPRQNFLDTLRSSPAAQGRDGGGDDSDILLSTLMQQLIFPPEPDGAAAADPTATQENTVFETAILLTSRQVHDEASTVLYRHITHVVHLFAWKPPSYPAPVYLPSVVRYRCIVHMPMLADFLPVTREAIRDLAFTIVSDSSNRAAARLKSLEVAYSADFQLDSDGLEILAPGFAPLSGCVDQVLVGRMANLVNEPQERVRAGLEEVFGPGIVKIK